jgi:hypothetical protein
VQESEPPFQQLGLAWSPFRSDIQALLRCSRHAEISTIWYGSNGCFLVKLFDQNAGESLAIYKPARGEHPLWDFPQGTLYQREVAMYQLNRLAGWDLVPPTVITRGQFGIGSLQLFIEPADESAVDVSELRRLCLLDWLANNADRKPDHLLLDSNAKLWGIDHGLTFHTDPKLRTVLWHFAGEPLDEQEMADLTQVLRLLRSHRACALRELITEREYRALLRRTDSLIADGVFPDPNQKRIPYRW